MKSYRDFHPFYGVLVRLLLVGAFLSPHLLVGEAVAVSLGSASGPLPATDLVNAPNNFYSFDGDIITWKMDDLFRVVFDDPILQNQVRLAFGEWETASSSATRRSSPRYAWARWNGYRNFSDLRSAMTHEIGHTLGSQHPDAAYFNENYQLNFRLDDQGDWFAAPPLGGEVMNEGNVAGFLPDSKPDPKGLRGGEYWRTLSKDELAMLDHTYDRHLDFQEVGPNDEAMITVKIHNLFGMPGDNIGSAGPDTSSQRNPNDPLDGRELLTASVSINATPNTVIGIRPHSQAWEYTNLTGQMVEAISIRTEGTNNRNPLGTTSSGGHRFTSYDPSSAVGIFDFENIGHIFSDPVGGAIPHGSTVTVGLSQDVWDWYSTGANVRTTDDEIFPANLVSILPWGVGEYGLSGEPVDPSGLSESPGVFTLAASGLRIVNSDQTTVLSELALAIVEGRGLTLDDLTRDTMHVLSDEGLLVPISLPPTTLAPGAEFFVIFDGDRDDLPPELIAQGNYLIVDDPRWDGALANDEIFAYARTNGPGNDVAAFALLNEDPIVGRVIPEPTTLSLAVILLLSIAIRRQRRV